MSTFIEYFRDCAENGEEVVITANYFDKLTYTDVCMLVHYGNFTINEEDFEKHPYYRLLQTYMTVGLEKKEHQHELLTLMAIYEESDSIPSVVQYREEQKHKIARDLLQAADNCGVIINPSIVNFIHSLYSRGRYPLGAATKKMKDYLGIQDE